MIRALVTLDVKDEADVSTLKDLLAEHGKLSRAEPGCLRFEAYQSQTTPTRFFLCEYWETQAALDVHRTAKGFTEIYGPKVIPMVNRHLDLLDVVE